jgi:pimeloyl-ACP methyl ester carboxylesterase
MAAVRLSPRSRFPSRRADIPSIALGVIVLAAVLSGCSGRSSAEAYHRTEPSELYLYTPPNYEPGTAIQLLLALHGEGQDAYDCYDYWRTYADENGLVLLCPELPYSDGRLDRIAAQTVIGRALQTAYGEVSLRGTFFVVGFGEGGALGLQYASQFPQAITGVVAIASEEFPALTGAALMPVLILTPSGNRTATEAARAYAEQMAAQGVAIRLVELDENGNRLTGDAGRMTSEFLAETLR